VIESRQAVIHELMNSNLNKEEQYDQWKESSIVPIHKIGDKTGYNSYHGLSLLLTSYKIYQITFSNVKYQMSSRAPGTYKEPLSDIIAIFRETYPENVIIEERLYYGKRG
jgi:hypothetical protein